MSEEQLKAFLEKVKADASLQEKLEAARSPEEVVGIAKEQGYEFTTEQLTDFGELSEEQLAGISGGASQSEGFISPDVLAKTEMDMMLARARARLRL